MLFFLSYLNNQINDFIKNQIIYFVLDAETQTSGQALDIPNTVWTIGTIDDANESLLLIQQDYLKQCSDRFTVCHSTLNDDGTKTWRACDLTQEPENTDQIYQIFNVIVADYTEIIGLDNAKNQIEKVKANFLNWSGLSSVIVLNELPKAPKIT